MISETSIKKNSSSNVRESKKYQSAKSLLHEISQIRDNAKVEQSEILSKKSHLQELFENVKMYNDKIHSCLDDSKNCISDINKIKEDTNSKYAEFKNILESLHEIYSQIKMKKEEIVDSYEDIMALYECLITGSDDKPSIESMIKELNKNYNNELSDLNLLKEKITLEINELRSSLETEIRSLLPDAGAAGLASGYVNSKKRYGFIDYNPTEKSHKFIKPFKAILFYLYNNFSTLLYYTLFIAPMVYIYRLFKSIDIQTIKVGILFFKVLISSPLAIISYFGFTSIKMNRRLYEEYNHKQRIMQLYHSFSEIIDKNGKEDEKTKLLNIMLETVNSKPSLIIQNSERMSFLSKLCEEIKNKKQENRSHE